MGIAALLGLFGRVPYVGKFLGSKWFWIIAAVVGTVWFVDHVIDEYGDSIRDQIITQFRANEYRQQAEQLQVLLESERELAVEQGERIAEIEAEREQDRAAFRRRLRELQNSGLQGGTISPYLEEAARQASRPDGLSYEDYLAGRTDDPTPED